MNEPAKEPNIILKMHPLQRILLGLLTSTLTFFIIPKSNMSGLLIGMILWIAFALVYNTTSWITLFTRPVAQIKKVAMKDDGSKVFVFIMILVASFASTFTVLLLMISKDGDSSSHPLFLPVAVVGMLMSWIMVHTIFVFHYAHMYYDEKRGTAQGLQFPGDEKPDYIDFAYFSFVIGCTFQVSDVEIASKKIRRMVLMHGLLSFILNTFVVALTINIIAGLNK